MMMIERRRNAISAVNVLASMSRRFGVYCGSGAGEMMSHVVQDLTNI